MGTKGWKMEDIVALDKKNKTDVLGTQVFNKKDFGDSTPTGGEIVQPDAGKRAKYGNKKVQIDGIWFDSKREGEYYKKLKILETHYEIYDLKCQVPFVIEINGKKICTYKADFTYYITNDKKKELCVDDVKGMRTPVYNLKKKLMDAVLNIQIQEV